MTPIDVRKISWRASSRFGAVAAGEPESVAAGLSILEAGGNAADAAAATILALTVTDHGRCSIGGEVPLLIFDAKRQEVKVLCGQGRAPRSEEAIAWYMQHGIPGSGDMKMAPVPAVVDLCVTALIKYGTLSFEQAVAPALALLDTGSESWHPRLAVTLRKLVDEERRTPGSRATKLRAASDRFYGGIEGRTEIADALEAYYVKRGGFLRKGDLAAHFTPIEDPVTIDYKGYTICKCGPWTQGPCLLQALRLLEGFDLKAMGRLSADTIHVVTEALKLAMADRDAYYGDPSFVGVPLPALLSDRYTALRRPLIDLHHASLEARPGDPYRWLPIKEGGGCFRPAVGGTTTCVVSDAWGNVVSATPSANVYRNQEAIEESLTGVTYGNRLRSLNATPGHPNCIAPGKLPRITLTPTLILREGVPVMAISVAGGDLQDQVTLQLILDVIEFGLSPAEAVTTPRFAILHHEDSFNPHPDRTEAFLKAGQLRINESIDGRVRDELARRGHRIETTSSPIGDPVILAVDHASGRVHVAGDPSAKRYAGGL